MPSDTPIPAVPGTLAPDEPHPSAYGALEYLKSILPEYGAFLMESYSSCALEGNRLAEICAETLRRLMAGETISDRYLLGLIWSVRELIEKSNQHQNPV